VERLLAFVVAAARRARRLQAIGVELVVVGARIGA
jgi:hypothetical protein